MRDAQKLLRAGRVISSGFSWPRVALICLVCLAASAVFSSDSAHGSSRSTLPSQDRNDCEQARKTVQQLTADVDQLKRKVADLDKYRQIDYLRDLLTKEEQRAEALQSQLLDIGDKEAPVQSRIDELDDQLRPENIDQALAGVGSMRPEEAKEALRRRLSNEKRRQQTQLDLLHQSRARLQASLATADASIQRLRLRLTELSHP
jgi:chromosome segregation ATPase